MKPYLCAIAVSLLSTFSLPSAEANGQSDIPHAPESALVAMEKTLVVEGTHLIVPVANGRDAKPFAKNAPNVVVLGIYDGDKLVQSFTIALPQANAPFWLAAYPLERYSLAGKQIRLATIEGPGAPENCRPAFESIKTGPQSVALAPSDYSQPYRNQFHASTRRGWNNDPNGMVFHGGKYHLYYQCNPLGIFWGNMHWGHLESTDLVYWEEKPLAIAQKFAKGGIWSGSGFVDVNATAGLGKGTLFVAYTSQGGENIAYSQDGGLTFTPIPENPVVKHRGRDPKVIWFAPEQKWVMAVYCIEPCPETQAVPITVEDKRGGPGSHIAFYESKNLRQWTRSGAFTDGDRKAVFECPELFELPVAGKPGESRWILLGAENRYFVGKFDGKTFVKESGPLGTDHGAFYAAQTFSDVPDRRRIQMGWVRTDAYLQKFPDQIVNQAFTLPHELTLRETAEGLRLFFQPIKELESLRGEVLAVGSNLTPAKANELLEKCKGALTEVVIETTGSGMKTLTINGMDASFTGANARVFTDSTFNEIYAADGLSYEIRKRAPAKFDSTDTRLTAPEGETIRSLKIFRIKSIWAK